MTERRRTTTVASIASGPSDEQQDILRLLQENALTRGRLQAMRKCNAKTCGRPDHCMEACAFGRQRRRSVQTPLIARLLANEHSLFELQVSRSSWDCGLGKLNTDTIVAALQLNRRALDKLQESALAVGVVKVLARPARYEEKKSCWRWELHEIVACSSKDILEDAFSSGRLKAGPESYVCVRPINNLNDAIERVLSDDLVQWKQPRDTTVAGRSSQKWRKQYYRWLLQLAADERLIRYGCDRYFNRIKKPPRAAPRPKRPRPYPLHLKQYMFGNHPPRCRCKACGG